MISTLSIHSTNTTALQEKGELLYNENDVMIALQQELKNPAYAKEILPNDFGHLLYLVKSGAQGHQPPIYLRSVIKLFSNLLKKSHYVNAQEFSDSLQKLTAQLPSYFTLPASRAYISNPSLYSAIFADRFQVTVNSLLYSEFSTKFEIFRKNPTEFLYDVSTNIVNLAQEEMMQEQLRQSIIRFCDIALSKLVWDPASHEQTWEITKKIGEHLATLLEYNVLDDANDLDDLYWTLLNRYCYFMELVATDMPSSFYAAVRNDIRSNPIVLFALEEQDYIIESKLACMQRTLIEAETASYRHQAGLPRI